MKDERWTPEATSVDRRWLNDTWLELRAALEGTLPLLDHFGECEHDEECHPKNACENGEYTEFCYFDEEADDMVHDHFSCRCRVWDIAAKAKDVRVVLKRTMPPAGQRTNSATVARLDEDGTAKPKTEIVGVFPEGDGRTRTVHLGQAESYVVRPTSATVACTTCEGSGLVDNDVGPMTRTECPSCNGHGDRRASDATAEEWSVAAWREGGCPCTTCDKSMSWEGDPPDDASEARCNTCVSEENRALRAKVLSTDYGQLLSDERVGTLDRVLKWLDRNGHAEAAKAVFAERPRFYLPEQKKRGDGT